MTSFSALALNLWQLPALVAPPSLSLFFLSPHSASVVCVIGDLDSQETQIGI